MAVVSDASFKSVKKRVNNLEGDLKGLDKDLSKEHDKDLDKLSKQISKLTREIEALRKMQSAEKKAVRQDFQFASSRDTELGRRIKDLGRAQTALQTKIEVVSDTLVQLDNRMANVEAAWNPSVLKQIVGNLESFSRAISSLEKHSASTLKNIERTNNGVLAIARHAKDIEAEHMDAKIAATELADKTEHLNETVKQFFKQTEAVNSRLDANMSVLNEITNTIQLMKNRLDASEQRAMTVAQLREMMDEANKYLEQLAQRMAYLEKICAKTIVIE